jgi:hypothetical protein
MSGYPPLANGTDWPDTAAIKLFSIAICLALFVILASCATSLGSSAKVSPLVLHGRFSVKDRQLEDEHSQPVQLRAATIPLFCSEWGTTDSSGHGSPYPAETAAWIDFLDRNGWSWCNWSLSPTAEGSAALLPYFSVDSGKLSANLSESGKLVRQLLVETGTAKR